MSEQLGRNESPVEGRFALLVVGVCAMFLVFAFRLFQLQVVESESLRARSLSNSVRTVRLEAARGDILDREGRVLATTRPAFDVSVIPNDVRTARLTYAALGQLLGEDGQLLRDRVGAPRGRKRFQPFVLAADLTWDRLARVESHRYALPGVITDVRPLREYRGGALAPHVLGTIGEVTREQLARREFADYRAGEIVGQSGIEVVLEADLRGRAGGRNVVVDVSGRVVEVLDEVEPLRGLSAELTLDLDLQRAAVAAFEAQASEGETPTGALVALNPRNGEVLALVSLPAYDPDDFADGIDRKRWRALTKDPLRPLRNRALSGQYPPGSTYKAFVAAAALQEGLVEPSTRFFCPGSFKLGTQTYRCWKHAGHGSVDLRQALEQSCDVWFYNVGLKLGIDRLAYFARGMGLGRETGIELGGEAPGLVPTKAWKLRARKRPWVKGETVSASIGQGQNLVTPLQLAVAYATIANGGTLIVPRLLRRIADRSGAVLRAPSPRVRGTAPVDAAHLRVVTQGLVDVVSGAHGTGRRAAVEGVAVAGKTGTAQVVRLRANRPKDKDAIPREHRDHAWYAAFAPADDPEIVVVAFNEHGGSGSSAAGPIAGAVLNAYFAKRNAAAEAAATALPDVSAALEQEALWDQAEAEALDARH